MGHPSRDDHVQRLAAELAEIGPRISYQDAIGTEFSLLASAGAAWRLLADGATHHLVLQDDVLPDPRLVDRLLPAIRQYPQAGLALFCEWGCKSAHAARIAALAGFGATEVIDKYIPTNALVLPAWVCAPVAQRLAHAGEHGPAPDDTIVEQVLDEFRVPCVLMVPTLVEDLSLPSLAGNQEMGVRRSVCALASSGPAGPPAPAGCLVGLVKVPFFQWRTGRALLLYRTGPRASWQRDELSPTLDEHGLTDQRTRDLIAEATAGVSADCRHELAQIQPWLASVSQVAVALLMAAASLCRPEAVRLDDPVTRESLRTLIPGALRCLAPGTTQPASATALSDFTGRLMAGAMAQLATGQLTAIECVAR